MVLSSIPLVIDLVISIKLHVGVKLMSNIDTGNVHQDDADSGRPYSQPFRKGDIVGCGYDLGRGAGTSSFFFRLLQTY